MSDTYFYAGGTKVLYEGLTKNFWKIKDSGSSLSVVTSLYVGGAYNVMSIAHGLDGSIYIGDEHAVYKYDSSLSLDTSWATGGSYSCPDLAAVAVNAEGKLAIAHDVDGGGSCVTLLDSDGGLLWGIAVLGTDSKAVRFLDEEYILIGLCSEGTGFSYGRRVKISDGSAVNIYAGFYGDSYCPGLDYDRVNEKVYFAIKDNDYGYQGEIQKYPVNGTESPIKDWNQGGGGPLDILLHSNGYVYYVGFPQYSTSKDIFKLSNSDGSVLDYYEANNVVYSIIENDDTNIVVGGSTALSFGGILYDIGVLDTDLTFLRGIQLDTLINTLIGKNIVPVDPPVITDQSEDTAACIGQLVDLFITATGNPTPTYQWYKDDIVMPGETNDTMSFYAQCSDIGVYVCKAGNGVNFGDSYKIENSSVFSVGRFWRTQTFTASAGYKIDSIEINVYLQGVGMVPGTAIVGIREVDEDGYPIGEDLCSGTFNAGLLPAYYGNRIWQEITFENGITLVEGEKYAIVVRAPDGNLLNYFNWVGQSLGEYSGGQEVESTDGGESWEFHVVESDCMFIVNGLGEATSDSMNVKVGANPNIYNLFDLHIDSDRS